MSVYQQQHTTSIKKEHKLVKSKIVAVPCSCGALVVRPCRKHAAVAVATRTGPINRKTHACVVSIIIDGTVFACLVAFDL